jgi:hypothetical protein
MRDGAIDMATAESTWSRPVPPPARGWASLGTWFEAPTAHGPLRLYLGEPDGPAVHAASAALALQRAGGLLAELDAWLGDAAPDWRWMPAGTGASSAANIAASPAIGPATAPTTLRLPWRDSAHQLIVPWAWLRAQAAAPDALAARWHWPATEALLAAAWLRLSADELRQLEPGGAVLLPASMRPGWTGRLRGLAEADDAGVAVALDDPAAPCVLPGPATAQQAAPAAPGRLYELRLHLSRAIPADRLTAWHAQPLADAMAPELAATLWQLPAAREPGCGLAHGRLLPWGDGWALLIDGLGEEVAQEAAQAHVSPA